MAEQKGRASGQLSSDDGSLPALPANQAPAGPVTGRFQAVVNVHDCNLNQIEVAIQNNLHTHDPHPAIAGELLERHPIYLVAVDYSKLDETGNPSDGKPAELNLKLIREVFSTRYPHVSPDPPPDDASHIQVKGMHFVAEVDSSGKPTGGVRLGNPEDVG